ncbi:hypothetical protein [Rickettsia endosymbiont of Orchestes rusci]|uniref:hypothetical protein n=1 Tax=Rickettsia endosymbiont of Orchestes rusci TaxID=3066250 RepID=UPI00313BA6EC
MSYYDFNTATNQANFDLIPKGTIAKVNLRIKRGGYNDAESGWTGGYATKNDISGAIYLDCEFTILSGEYAKRRVWSMIGLYSEKNNNRWGEIGRSFIRSILNSARGFSDKEDSEYAKYARKINNFGDLENLEFFITRIDIEVDQSGNEKNVIKVALDPYHKDYVKFMDNNADITDIAGWR